MGILVFQASLDSLDEMRGLAIYHKRFPIIMLNTKDSTRGKVFSLLHEFCHLLLRKSGIGNIDANWKTKGKVNPVEVFCNEFAGQCLLPHNRIQAFIRAKGLDVKKLSTDSSLRSFVNYFQASWEVVLRRFLEERYIPQAEYSRRRSELIASYAKAAKKKSGQVPIELRALAYNGEAYTALVLDGYDRQKLTSGDLVDYLGVSYKHIDKVRTSIAKKGKGA
jgi:Zn-dependent peptidase ImmA (M78 family)